MDINSTKKINERIKELIGEKLSYKAIADDLQLSVDYVKMQATELNVAYSYTALSEKERLDIFGRAVKGFPLDAIAGYYGVTIEDINSIVQVNTPKPKPSYKEEGYSKKLDPFKEEIKKDCAKNMSIGAMVEKYKPLTYDGKLCYQTMWTYLHKEILPRGQKKFYPRVERKNQDIHSSRKAISFTLSSEAYAVAKTMSPKQLGATMNRVLVRQA
jgi:hypothetical protein